MFPPDSPASILAYEPTQAQDTTDPDNTIICVENDIGNSIKQLAKNDRDDTIKEDRVARSDDVSTRAHESDHVSETYY